MYEQRNRIAHSGDRVGRGRAAISTAGVRDEDGRTIEPMAGQKTSPRSVALPAIREDVRRIAAAHGAGNVRVFGSVGRGEQDASSDLDLLVEMAEGRSLFDLIALSNDLEESLGVEVDVVTEASLSPYMRDRVLDEAVAVEGKQEP